MTAHTPLERKAVTAGGRLRGFSGGAKELDDTPVEVRGELPGWLRGDLLLNGPALWELAGGAYRHWFDGLAMLHRVRIGQEGVTYRSRFLRSRDYVESTGQGKPSVAGFGTADPPGFWRRVKGVFSPQATDNGAVVMSDVGGRWAAMTETPAMTGFDPDTLATHGRLAFDDRETLHLMAAHGTQDAQGTYWNVGVEFGPTCTYKLFRVERGSRTREVVSRIPVKSPGYLHAFALTPRHAIIWEPAWRAQPLRFMFTGNSYMDNFEWMPQAGSKIHAVALDDGRVATWDVPPMMCFHAVQAYESADAIVLELCTYEDAGIVRELMLEPRRKGEPIRCLPRLARYTLRQGQAATQPEFFGPMMELPQVHPSRWTQGQATVAWGAGGEAGVSPFFDRTVRLDIATGGATSWQRPDAIQLEPLFAARPGGDGEEAGVLLVPTLADADAGTVIGVVDPARMDAIAELRLPQVVPFGFHAAFKGA